nr:MAG: hypothetical protein 3 [Leviviridae sp.]
MKSQSDNLLHIVAGIHKDIQQAYPTLKGLDLDYERLSLLVSSRGLGVFTLDLPARDASLLRGLESGLLDSSGTKRYSKKYPVPRLYAGLYMRIFDRDLRLKSDADVNAIMFLRQIFCLGKKIEVPCSKKRKLQAIEDYVHVEQQLIAPTLNWGDDALDYPGDRVSVHLCDGLGLDLPLFPDANVGRSREEQLLLNRCQRVADKVSEWLGTFCPECFIETNRAEGRRLGFRHGPGAVAERSGKLYNKYKFLNWSAKLQAMYPWETTGRMPNDSLAVRPLNHEVPARLICVPKTAKGPRIIAAEPSEHMFTQNLFADWLLSRLSDTHLRHFIDLKNQALSGQMVLQASLDRKLSTIDLSSASDRLSMWVVERVFRRNPSILRAIHATRTRWLRLPNGECLELKKFASQGTALTFPVQTIVFLVIALAASMDGDPADDKSYLRMKGQVRVYGDDIIVPTTRYAETVGLLTTLFLKVNQEKSFSAGHFRESCGVDAFKGYDVTPIKPRTTISDNPASCQAVLDTINNLFYKGHWNASEQLKNRQPPRFQSEYGVVGRDAGATGYGSFSLGTMVRRFHELLSRYSILYKGLGRFADAPIGQRDKPRRPYVLSDELFGYLRRYGYRSRWNSKHHRYEVRLLALQGVSQISPYDCGYTGILDGQLRPTQPQSFESSGVRGVPARPSYRKVARWEALESLYSRS